MINYFVLSSNGAIFKYSYKCSLTITSVFWSLSSAHNAKFRLLFDCICNRYNNHTMYTHIMKKILLTCPPMLKQFERYKEFAIEKGLDVYCAPVTQIMTEDELIDLVPQFDGWIIGDDPATRRVFEAGIQGKLKAAVKWGVGVDNVDFEACKDLNIPITNIPGVFGEEVSDVGIGYLLGLSRKLFEIDAAVKQGQWVKPCGSSLSGKKVCLIGFGDIGRCSARKLLAFNIDVYVSDPGFRQNNDRTIECIYNSDIKVSNSLNSVHITSIEDASVNCDYFFITCALNSHTRHLINKDLLLRAKKGVRIINVARGSIVCEAAVIELLESGHIDAVAFDVFEIEPLKIENSLRKFPQNIFGTHNGSNSIDGVDKTSYIAIETMQKYLFGKI
jgi:D-3-phosphoglycerate dehydrogenase